MIRLLEYEPVTGRLMVQRGDTLMTYLSVPLETFLGLRFAPQPDVYFSTHVAGRFVRC
jgi:hypothetical protein